MFGPYVLPLKREPLCVSGDDEGREGWSGGGGAEERNLHVFEVKDQTLIYTRSPVVYSRDPSRKDVFRKSVSERATCSWREDLTVKNLLGSVNYNTSGETTSQQPERANVKKIVSRLQGEKELYQEKPTSRAEKRAIWRSEQKIFSQMSDLLQKFSKGGGLAINLCTDTHSTAKACLLLDQHTEFVECDVNLEVLSAAKPDLVLTIASQVLNPKSEVSGSGEVQPAAGVFTTKMGASLARKKAAVWEIPPGREATKVMSRSVPHFLPTLYENCSLYEMCRHVLSSIWLLV